MRFRLLEDPITRLTAWHERVADEPHRCKHDPPKQSHDVTQVPMISRQGPIQGAVAILTPSARDQLATLFAKRP